MEDSGREKLQGQTSNNAADDAVKKAGNQDTNIDFDSAKIDKNKKEEHFKNIEGAEERAKAAERAKEEAKRAAEKAQEKADKIQAKIDETPLQKKARLKKTGIIVGIVALVAVIGVVVFILRLRYDNVSDDQAKEDAIVLYKEAKELLGNGNAESRKKAREYFEKKIEKSSGTHKFYNSLIFVEYLRQNGYSMDDCEEVLSSLQDLVDSEDKRMALLENKCETYVWYKSEKYYTECTELISDEGEVFDFSEDENE